MQLSDCLSLEDVVVDLAFNSEKDMLARLADLAAKRCKVLSAEIIHVLKDCEIYARRGSAAKLQEPTPSSAAWIKVVRTQGSGPVPL